MVIYTFAILNSHKRICVYITRTLAFSLSFFLFLLEDDIDVLINSSIVYFAWKWRSLWSVQMWVVVNIKMLQMKAKSIFIIRLALQLSTITIVNSELWSFKVTTIKSKWISEIHFLQISHRFLYMNFQAHCSFDCLFVDSFKTNCY